MYTQHTHKDNRKLAVESVLIFSPRHPPSKANSTSTSHGSGGSTAIAKWEGSGSFGSWKLGVTGSGRTKSLATLVAMHLLCYYIYQYNSSRCFPLIYSVGKLNGSIEHFLPKRFELL